MCTCFLSDCIFGLYYILLYQAKILNVNGILTRDEVKENFEMTRKQKKKKERKKTAGLTLPGGGGGYREILFRSTFDHRSTALSMRAQTPRVRLRLPPPSSCNRQPLRPRLLSRTGTRIEHF
jgi:hypothetical protein